MRCKIKLKQKVFTNICFSRLMSSEINQAARVEVQPVHLERARATKIPSKIILSLPALAKKRCLFYRQEVI